MSKQRRPAPPAGELVSVTYHHSPERLAIGDRVTLHLEGHPCTCEIIDRAVKRGRVVCRLVVIGPAGA